MLIIHEVMGRNWGWLTAATAAAYPKLIAAGELVPGLGLRRERVAVHGIVFPEMAFDISAETERLKRVMDAEDNVNLFVREGAGVETIVAELQSRGQDVPRDAFGRVKLDAVNPGKWFGDQFAKMVGAEKVLVQKSGYFRACGRDEYRKPSPHQKLCGSRRRLRFTPREWGDWARR